jgi:hypothetical protein
MTNLIEEIKVRISINHCVGDSDALGGKTNLRLSAVETVSANLLEFIYSRQTREVDVKDGIRIVFTNTGLMEVPEETGGDN